MQPTDNDCRWYLCVSDVCIVDIDYQIVRLRFNRTKKALSCFLVQTYYHSQLFKYTYVRKNGRMMVSEKNHSVIRKILDF